MRYIEALEVYEPQPGERSLFLAGGITGCPDWSVKYRSYFEDTDLVLLNPRRELVKDMAKWLGEKEGQKQIDWEHAHLRKASAVSFWFPAEGKCIISMYELGAALERTRPVFVGVHPLYWKQRSVVYQTYKQRPEVEVVGNLRALANQVRALFGYVPLPEEP